MIGICVSGLGVDPATGAGLWNLYYDDINDNGIFDNGDAPISSMTIYMNDNPDAKVLKQLHQIILKQLKIYWKICYSKS